MIIAVPALRREHLNGANRNIYVMFRFQEQYWLQWCFPIGPCLTTLQRALATLAIAGSRNGVASKCSIFLFSVCSICPLSPLPPPAGCFGGTAPAASNSCHAIDLTLSGPDETGKTACPISRNLSMSSSPPCPSAIFPTMCAGMCRNQLQKKAWPQCFPLEHIIGSSNDRSSEGLDMRSAGSSNPRPYALSI